MIRAVKGCVVSSGASIVHSVESRHGALLTWTLFRHSWVRLLIFEPETPGGFRFCISPRPFSSSATAACDDDKVDDILFAKIDLVQLKSGINLAVGLGDTSCDVIRV